MKIIPGALRLKRWSNSINQAAGVTQLTWQEALLLIALGSSAVVLHAIFRWPLRLPGHHGLEWMALLIIGRSLSQYRWASTVSSISAAGIAMIPVWGFGDPFIAIIYFLPGLVIDGGFNLGSRWQKKVAGATGIWFLAALAALAHATKPLARVMISLISGWPYGSLLYGVAYPLVTHLVFGLLGGLAGALLVRSLRER